MISLVIKKDNSALHEQAYFYIQYPHSYLIFLQQLKKKKFLNDRTKMMNRTHVIDNTIKSRIILYTKVFQLFS